MSVSFFVPGVPVPQGSKRHVGRGILVESSRALAPWRSTVQLAARQAHSGPLIDGPVEVFCEFTFPRPKRHYRANGDLREDAPYRHSSRPDLDKLLRSVLDALSGVVIRDDGQVSVLRGGKRYGDEPGVEVLVAA